MTMSVQCGRGYRFFVCLVAVSLIQHLCLPVDAFYLGVPKSFPSQRAGQLTMKVPKVSIAQTVNSADFGPLEDNDPIQTSIQNPDDLLGQRVVVAIRYTDGSDMAPYYLTVAKKVKEAFPDVILDRLILPKKIEMSTTTGDNKQDHSPAFEVWVDGKRVIPVVGKKTRDSVFVSMQELEGAITRARKRRRNVYREGGTTKSGPNNLRIEMLKAKAASAVLHSQRQMVVVGNSSARTYVGTSATMNRAPES